MYETEKVVLCCVYNKQHGYECDSFNDVKKKRGNGHMM
jgi:hypothetical protein